MRRQVPMVRSLQGIKVTAGGELDGGRKAYRRTYGPLLGLGIADRLLKQD